MPHAEGSIADYDLMLSISAEAINRQFQVLYGTEIKTLKDFIPPSRTKVKDASPAAPAEYLINHRLEIHIDKKGKPNPNYGLSAFIDCPQVSFEGLASKVNDYRTAKISIKFIKEGNVDSKFKEPYITDDMQIEIQETIVTDWTMSWEVKLGRHDIQNIMEDLINPAQSGESASILHPKATIAFDNLHKENEAAAKTAKANGVDSRNFLVSSIFCVFQAAQMANTFQLHNPEGKILQMGEAPGDFMLTVSKYFTGMQVKEGQMTPDNPFVLGYGISQELPQIKEVNSEINHDLTPRFLVPKSFQLTCTPGSMDSYGSRYTSGTLNFCILTYSPTFLDSTTEQPGRTTNGETNPSAGVLDQTLFSKTRTSSHDGVMAFCKEIIFDKYICGNLGSKFLMDPKLIVKGLCQWNGSTLEGDLMVTPTFTSQPGRPPVFKMERNFTHHMADGDDTFMKNRREVEGSTWVKLSMTSDLLDNPTSLIDKDAKRRTYIDVSYGANVNHRNQTQGKVRDYQMESGWSTQYWAALDMSYKARLILQAGKAGVWSVTRDPDNQLYPYPEFEDGGKKLKVTVEHMNGRTGAFVTGGKGPKPANPTEGTTWWSVFGSDSGIMNHITSVQLGIATPVKDFETNISNALGDLKQTVIMPAGDAFLFTGIDCDEKGNLYSHVTYSQGSEGATQKK